LPVALAGAEVAPSDCVDCVVPAAVELVPAAEDPAGAPAPLTSCAPGALPELLELPPADDWPLGVSVRFAPLPVTVEPETTVCVSPVVPEISFWVVEVTVPVSLLPTVAVTCGSLGGADEVGEVAVDGSTDAHFSAPLTAVCVTGCCSVSGALCGALGAVSVGAGAGCALWAGAAYAGSAIGVPMSSSTTTAFANESCGFSAPIEPEPEPEPVFVVLATCAWTSETTGT
jgi:hypothetical protein